METDYEENALRIAKEIGLGIKIERAKKPKPASWSPSGHHYSVTLTSGGRSITFDFWGSAADAANGKNPGVYDVLSCIAADASWSTDPDEIAEELGPMKPSAAFAAAAFAKKLQDFFTPVELDKLYEIQ